MSIKMSKGDLAEMESITDEKGEVFLSVRDLIRHLRGNQHRMTEVQPEHVTADRMIELLQRFERGIKQEWKNEKS